jgi:glycosyltransferase involved in cell wall biosynthesis
MGKNNKNNVKTNKTHKLPRVSICTPTFNRRPFFKGLIHNVMSQKYPKELIEWIIVDDGTDKVGDLVKDIPFAKYISVEKMPLGRKRNFMHDQCSFQNDDDIIVYMDDDDFYPPERVSHAVEKLTNSNALCAGSSEMYIWFNTLDKMYRFGPYGPKHSTAGTFAFKRELLKTSRYEDNALLAEEKHFLKDYTVPFVQLDTLKTILVFSHEQNTFDKRRLIDTDNKYCFESSLKVSNFIKNEEIRNFYMNEIGNLLKDYEPGDIKNKPDVINEIKRRDQERMIQNNNQSNAQVAVTLQDGTKHILTQPELIEALQFKSNEVIELKKQLEDKNKMINLLIGKIKMLDSIHS